MNRRRATEPEPPLHVVRALRARATALSYAAVLLAVVAIVAACDGSGDLPLDQVDPQAAPADPTYDQVAAILHNRCTMCHSGENARADLTDCVQIVSLRDDIVTRIEDNIMPPGAMPRLTNEQKLLIRRWVENGAPAPCN